jgi:hypothetical protein
MFCQDIKCPDYFTGEGEPAWCYRAGMPAQVAVGKCLNRENGEKKNTGNKHEKQTSGSQ